MRKPLDKTRYGWWKQAVFYPRSFQDTDGVGDLPGSLPAAELLQSVLIKAAVLLAGIVWVHMLRIRHGSFLLIVGVIAALM